MQLDKVNPTTVPLEAISLSAHDWAAGRLRGLLLALVASLHRWFCCIFMNFALQPFYPLAFRDFISTRSLNSFYCDGGCMHAGAFCTQRVATPTWIKSLILRLPINLQGTSSLAQLLTVTLIIAFWFHNGICFKHFLFETVWSTAVNRSSSWNRGANATAEACRERASPGLFLNKCNSTSYSLIQTCMPF